MKTRKYILNSVAVLFVFASVACHSIQTEITIDAPPEKVWKVFEETASYPDWNPFIQKVEGDYLVDEQITIHLKTVGGSEMSFEPVILEKGEDHLTWRGRLLMPGIFTGEHSFKVEATGENKTRFIQRESFSGILVPIFDFEDTENSLHAMNTALKNRVIDKRYVQKRDQ